MKFHIKYMYRFVYVWKWRLGIFPTSTCHVQHLWNHLDNFLSNSTTSDHQFGVQSFYSLHSFLLDNSHKFRESQSPRNSCVIPLSNHTSSPLSIWTIFTFPDPEASLFGSPVLHPFSTNDLLAQSFDFSKLRSSLSLCRAWPGFHIEGLEQGNQHYRWQDTNAMPLLFDGLSRGLFFVETLNQFKKPFHHQNKHGTVRLLFLYKSC